MVTILGVFLVLAMLATVAVLVTGLAGLARPGDPHRSNRLMQWRIGFQALALLIVVILLTLRGH